MNSVVYILVNTCTCSLNYKQKQTVYHKTASDVFKYQYRNIIIIKKKKKIIIIIIIIIKKKIKKTIKN